MKKIWSNHPRYYWFYYYTFHYSPSTYVTRESTTITRTTTVTCSATDSYEADIYFLSVANDLPTPASAGVYLPATPTSGATILGSCSTTSTYSDGDISLGCAVSTQGLSTAGASTKSFSAPTATDSLSSVSSIAASSASGATFTGGSTSGSASLTISDGWFSMALATCGLSFFVLMCAL